MDAILPQHSNPEYERIYEDWGKWNTLHAVNLDSELEREESSVHWSIFFVDVFFFLNTTLKNQRKGSGLFHGYMKRGSGVHCHGNMKRSGLKRG